MVWDNVTRAVSGTKERKASVFQLGILGKRHTFHANLWSKCYSNLLFQEVQVSFDYRGVVDSRRNLELYRVL